MATPSRYAASTWRMAGNEEISRLKHISNRGVHGEIVDQKYLDFASEAYPKIIDALDDCKELIKKMT